MGLFGRIVKTISFVTAFGYAVSSFAQTDHSNNLFLRGEVDSVVKISDSYDLGAVLDVESTYRDFDKEVVDSVAGKIVSEAYGVVYEHSLCDRESVLDFARTLTGKIDEYFYPATHEYFSESLKHRIETPSLRAPANCMQYSLLFSTVLSEYKDDHPDVDTRLELVRAGNGRNSHVLTRFTLVDGEHVYFDPSLARETSAAELIDCFEISDHALDSDWYLQPLSARQNLANELLHHAHKLRANGDTVESFETLEYVLDIEPDFPSALYNEMTWLMEEDSLDASKEVARYIFDHDFTSAKAAYVLGRIEHKKGAYDAAIDWYENASSWSGSYIAPEYWRARAFLDKGAVDTARKIGLDFMRDSSSRYSAPGRKILRMIDEYSSDDPEN